MGQALRRATSQARTGASTQVRSPPPPSQVHNVEKRPPPPPPPRPPVHKVELKPKTEITQDGTHQPINKDDIPGTNPDNVLEDKDPGYDAMLSQMVGRIKTKPGGKPEMGEAFIVERYDRPMPKLRNTKADSNYYEKSAPPGTLNVAQLRQILLLHEGKADDHDGPMDAQQIAESFRLDVLQVQKMLQFVSLPPEHSKKSDTK